VVVFSSGSTGSPKGIVLPWEALEHRWRVRWAEYDAFGFAVRRQALLLPLDSAWGLTEALDVASGFSMHVVDAPTVGPSDLLAALARVEPTSIALPPQLGRVLAQLPSRMIVPLPTVRRLYVTSEGFRYEYVAGLRSIFRDDTVMVHTLASTEVGRMLASTFTLGEAPASGPVPIGTPAHPADVRLEPVGDDGRAELVVSGPIALGYLRDPDLTAARFRTDREGRRWWRSGDLVTVGSDGLFRHAGRIDDLVKVGGRLVSPSDVTSVIAAIPGITAAITVPVVTEGVTRLVAHVEVDPAAGLTRADVHDRLRASLPAHSVPAAIMRHQRLPAGERGKIDRSALGTGPFVPW